MRPAPAQPSTLVLATLVVAAGLAGGAAAARRARAPDLDVAVPSGSPLEWGRSFPGYTPHDQPLWPVTGPSGETKGADDGTQRTRAIQARGAAAETEVRFASSFGMLRILTWDLAAHLGWIARPAAGTPSGPRGLGPRLPGHEEPLYWVALAPLLRLLLHPQLQAESETLAHLVEIGTPVHAVLEAAASEDALAGTVARLRRLIPIDAALPVPADSGTGRQRMLARFTLEELLREQPYDPTGEFGKRLFPFSEEVLPWLEAYAEHPSRELSRAAVTALGRYRTPRAAQALARVAARTPDPVTCVRALAALGPVRKGLDEQALIARLEGCAEPVLRAALIGALGRLGSRAALPALLELGARGLREHDSDLLITVLSALARIWPADGQRPALREFNARVRSEVAGDRKRWRAPEVKQLEPPDRPDLPSTRATILDQLTRVVATQADPGAKDTRERLLEMAVAGPADARLTGNGAVLPDPMASVLAPVRLLFLEGLSRVGEEGQVWLEGATRATALDSAERGRALTLLDWQRRSVRALTLFGDAEQGPAVRIEALETLLADHHDQALALCHQVLDQLAHREPGTPDAAQRYMGVRALRYLGDQGALDALELLALLPHVRRSPAALEQDRATLRTRLAALVAAAGRRGAARRMDQEIRELLDLAVALELRAEPSPEERRALEQGLESELADVPRHDSDPAWLRALIERWMVRLSGPPLDLAEPGGLLVASLAGPVLFQPSIPLEEELLLALGRTRSAAAAETLLALLRDERRLLRAWVCLAIGATGFEALAPELCPALLDPDPFVRLCAYESLRRLSKHDLAIDWMYAPAEERAAAAEEYRRCCAGR